MAAEKTPTPACHKSHDHSRLYRVMARHPELLCLLIVLILSVLSKYSKSYQPVVQSQPAPRRFFPSSSPVIDLAYGNILDAAELLHQDEFLFVMYYAPWCAACSHVRWEFDKAARYMENEVTFIGINCWYPEGSCRQQNNFSGFPVMFAYLSHLEGFRYSGILTAEYMVQFLEHLRYPLTPLHTMGEISTFTNNNDNAVIGFFDFNSSPQPPGWQQFYCSSMRTLQLDPKNTVEFGVISSKTLANSFNISRPKTVLLMRTNNETIKYPIYNNFTSSALTQWVLSMRQEPSVKWLLPSGTKSLSLSTEIEKGPALIMFTQQRPTARINFNYALLREIAADYHDCGNGSKVQDISSYRYHRWNDLSASLHLTKQCMTYREASTDGNSHMQSHKQTHTWKSCCFSTELPNSSIHLPMQNCNMCFHFHYTNLRHLNPCSILLKNKWTLLKNLYRNHHYSCQISKVNYNPSEFMSLCCKELESLHNELSEHEPFKLRKSADRWFTDPFVETKFKRGINHECHKAHFQRVHGWTGPSPNVNQLKGQEGYTADISGLACTTNKTVRFYAMNIFQSHHFLERLGVPVVHHENQTTVVIFDKKEESQYVMRNGITQQKIVDFIQKFTNGTLTTHPRSTDTISKSFESVDQQIHYIQEVTTNTLQKIVLDEDKDVVLLYHAPLCGFCAGFAHVYLSLAHFFRDSKNIVFARINTDENDLPWQYRVDQYPFIMIFPSKRKSDSVAFPSHLAKNLPNLIQFVSRHVSRRNKLEMGLRACSRACRRNNLEKVSYKLQTLQSEIWRLKRRIAQLEDKLILYKSSVTELQEISEQYDELEEKIIRLSVRIKTNEQYIALLKLELKKKQLQSQSARTLHNVLERTEGILIDGHKFEDLMRRYAVYTEQLIELANSDKSSALEEISDNALSADKTLQNSHDEL